MSEFRYLKEKVDGLCNLYIEEENKLILSEIAYQLKRIADHFENQDTHSEAFNTDIKEIRKRIAEEEKRNLTRL